MYRVCNSCGAFDIDDSHGCAGKPATPKPAPEEFYIKNGLAYSATTEGYSHHVIEKSAYDAVVRERDECVKGIEYSRKDWQIERSGHIKQIKQLVEDFDKLAAAKKTLNELLEDYKAVNAHILNERDAALALLREARGALELYSTMEFIDTQLERAVCDMDSSKESEGRGERYVCTKAREILTRIDESGVLK